MKRFSMEEQMLFATIMRVYEINPNLALSCISKNNIDRFEQFLIQQHGDKSAYIIQEIRELSQIKKTEDVFVEKINRR